MAYFPPYPGAFYFNDYSDNIAATPSNSPGTNFTAGGSSADGASVSILSALGHDAHRLRFGIYGLNASASDTSSLVDVLIDPAGGTSWSATPLISDLAGGFTGTTSQGLNIYDFQLYAPLGASLGVRARTKNATDLTGGRIVAQAWGNPSRPDLWWYGTAVETLGSDAANSKGTVITPGNSGTNGSWTSIGSTTTQRYGGVQLGINGSDSVMNAAFYLFEIGMGSARLPGSHKWWIQTTTTEIMTIGTLNPAPVFCDIPSGTQMQARATCSTTAEDYNVLIYGVY